MFALLTPLEPTLVRDDLDPPVRGAATTVPRTLGHNRGAPWFGLSTYLASVLRGRRILAARVCTHRRMWSFRRTNCCAARGILRLHPCTREASLVAAYLLGIYRPR